MGAERSRPWWASDDPGVDALARDEDPLTAYRAARRPAAEDGRPVGPRGDIAPPDQAPWPDAAWGPDHERRADPEPSAAGATHDPMTCGRCPVCIGLRLLGEHRPDVLHHLNEASRHLSAALRGVLEPGPDTGHADTGHAGTGHAGTGHADTRYADTAHADTTRVDRSSGRAPDRFERIVVDGPSEAEGAATADDDRGPGSWPA